MSENTRAKDTLYKMCKRYDDCLLSGQVKWIVEAMEKHSSDENEGLRHIIWKQTIEIETLREKLANA